MLCTEEGGFYCDKCRKVHPSLYWHEIYDEYLKSPEEYIPFVKEMTKRFADGAILSDKEAMEDYEEYMKILELEKCKEAGACSFCGTKTHYKHTPTNLYVCSDKCKHKARENKE